MNRSKHIDEYKQAGLDWRHDDQRFWQLTRLFLPLSFGAMVLPYLEVAPPMWFCVTAGMMLMAFWYSSFWLYKRRIKIRFERIHQLEQMLGFNYHLNYHKKVEGSLFKFRSLYTVMLIVYVALWVIVFIFKCCCNG